jgi:hypothetical protein
MLWLTTRGNGEKGVSSRDRRQANHRTAVHLPPGTACLCPLLSPSSTFAHGTRRHTVLATIAVTGSNNMAGLLLTRRTFDATTITAATSIISASNRTAPAFSPPCFLPTPQVTLGERAGGLLSVAQHPVELVILRIPNQRLPPPTAAPPPPTGLSRCLRLLH